jgi:hypothetical protein
MDDCHFSHITKLKRRICMIHTMVFLKRKMGHFKGFKKINKSSDLEYRL